MSEEINIALSSTVTASPETMVVCESQLSDPSSSGQTKNARALSLSSDSSNEEPSPKQAALDTGEDGHEDIDATETN